MPGERWAAPSTLDWEKKVFYAITISPEDQFNIVQKNELNNPNRVRDVIVDMKKLMRKLKYTYLELYVEVSSLGNIHFHGYIAVQNVIRFQTEEMLILKKHGNVVIKPLMNDDWDKYIKKDMSLWMSYLKKVNLYPEEGTPLTEYSNYPLICNNHIMSKTTERSGVTA